MNYAKLTCENYVEVLSSTEPVPGGGGASAMSAAIGVASGNMMCRLTLNKKRYAHVHDDFETLAQQAKQLERQFLELVTRDAEAFSILFNAYNLPEETASQQQKKADTLEQALRIACAVPFETMQHCCEAIALQKHLAERGTVNALSEVSVGVALCRGALQGAAASVFINTKLMQDRNYADDINRQAQDMLAKYLPMADAVYDHLEGRLIK